MYIFCLFFINYPTWHSSYANDISKTMSIQVPCNFLTLRCWRGHTYNRTRPFRIAWQSSLLDYYSVRTLRMYHQVVLLNRVLLLYGICSRSLKHNLVKLVVVSKAPLSHINLQTLYLDESIHGTWFRAVLELNCSG